MWKIRGGQICALFGVFFCSAATLALRNHVEVKGESYPERYPPSYSLFVSKGGKFRQEFYPTEPSYARANKLSGGILPNDKPQLTHRKGPAETQHSKYKKYSLIVDSPDLRSLDVNKGHQISTAKLKVPARTIMKKVIKSLAEGHFVPEVMEGVMLPTVDGKEAFVPQELLLRAESLMADGSELHPAATSPDDGPPAEMENQGSSSPYRFGWIVDDDGTQNFQTRQEEGDREGVITGCYQVLEPTGLVRTLKYRADNSGFQVLSLTKDEDKLPCPGILPPLSAITVTARSEPKEILADIKQPKRLSLSAPSNSLPQETTPSTALPTTTETSRKAEAVSDFLLSESLQNLTTRLFNTFLNSSLLTEEYENSEDNLISFPYVMIPISTYMDLKKRKLIGDDVQTFGAFIRPSVQQSLTKTLFGSTTGKPFDGGTPRRTTEFPFPKVTSTKRVETKTTSLKAETESTLSKTSKTKIKSSRKINFNPKSPEEAKVEATGTFQRSETESKSLEEKEILSKEISKFSLQSSNSRQQSASPGKLFHQVNTAATNGLRNVGAVQKSLDESTEVFSRTERQESNITTGKSNTGIDVTGVPLPVLKNKPKKFKMISEITTNSHTLHNSEALRRNQQRLQTQSLQTLSENNTSGQLSNLTLSSTTESLQSKFTSSEAHSNSHTEITKPNLEHDISAHRKQLHINPKFIMLAPTDLSGIKSSVTSSVVRSSSSNEETKSSHHSSTKKQSVASSPPQSKALHEVDFDSGPEPNQSIDNGSVKLSGDQPPVVRSINFNDPEINSFDDSETVLESTKVTLITQGVKPSKDKEPKFKFPEITPESMKGWRPIVSNSFSQPLSSSSAWIPFPGRSSNYFSPPSPSRASPVKQMFTGGWKPCKHKARHLTFPFSA